MSAHPQEGGDPFRPVNIDGFAGISAATDFGPAPMLQWLEVAQLVIDDSYQRGIRPEGRRNIRIIAESFRWSRFAPVLVAPIAGGRFAIIDGQHRAHAALLAGHKSVPCQIITADRQEQAQAFSAVNAQTTKVHALSIFKAALAAGDPKALRTAAVAERAGVRLLLYPMKQLGQKPGETNAVTTIGAAIERHGEEATTLALRCVTETANNVVGGLPVAIVAVLPEVVSLLLARGHDEVDILAHFARVNLIRELDKAGMRARETRGAVKELFRLRLLAPFKGAAA